jgi:4-amino-4-deoxy-L-arabinose transferase-like glycosyltransferase
MRDATVEPGAGRPRAVYAACGASLVLGLLFIFVRAPHPWGWGGFDHYHDIALELAHGRPFPTMDVPWGYAYFLAAFYRLFGDHPWIPLTAQVALNAVVPLLVFDFAATWLDRRTAAFAAVLTGVFSFNTVYASTQSSDAVCTCLFMAAVVAFARARAHDSAWLYVLVGALAGLAAQFRPNLILIPFVLAAYAVVERRTLRRAFCGALVVGGAAAMLAPWVARNYLLTETWLPTSVHGGVQLWYGTLQTGPYLNSRAYNPRSVFDAPAFDYTSLDGMPLVVRASLKQCMQWLPSVVELRYWTDFDRTERLLRQLKPDGATYTFEIPAPQRPAVVYYFLTARWIGRDTPMVSVSTPPPGARAPFVYFVSQDHLADLDRYGDLLDLFDLARLVRHDAWGDPVAFADRLGQAGVTDTRTAAARLAESRTDAADRLVTRLDHDDREARVTFSDGSTMTVPREWSGRLTDLEFSGGLAANLITARRSLAAMALAGEVPSVRDRCAELEDVTVNAPFYRQEPHMMRRYSALAFDNIRRDPAGFLLASAYRAVRLFVIVGTSDAQTAQQFERSRIVYAAGAAASAFYFVLLVGGVAIAYRRGDALWLPLLLILYVPATIAPVLTNMRYTVTVQPLIFMFVAVALLSGSQTFSRRSGGAGDPAALDRAGTRTARQP